MAANANTGIISKQAASKKAAQAALSQGNTAPVAAQTTAGILNAIYTCALRYAFGRMTYMPGLVTDYIKRHADTVTDKELGIMIRDLQEEIATAERIGDKHYGMDCDKRTWLNFYSWLLEEKARRDASNEE